jgi:iron-sulfur cluster repair protein YtfE (RIC family)
MTGARAEERQAIRTFVEHEHDELAAGMERIHRLGEELAFLPVDQRTACIQQVLRWIDADLKAHMSWEDSWLFPEIDARAGTPWATRLARFDHQQITAQAARLHQHCDQESHLPAHDIVMLAADLAGLEALLRANVEREERLLFPMLGPEAERWTPEWRD